MILGPQNHGKIHHNNYSLSFKHLYIFQGMISPSNRSYVKVDEALMAPVISSTLKTSIAPIWPTATCPLFACSNRMENYIHHQLLRQLKLLIDSTPSSQVTQNWSDILYIWSLKLGRRTTRRKRRRIYRKQDVWNAFNSLPCKNLEPLLGFPPQPCVFLWNFGPEKIDFPCFQRRYTNQTLL